ncbi:hypothetical protein [Paenibacillus glacialis]|uniref:Uncharacterized protein n=1 Tax=Paenibacillus glacialis TaxID=494026 RepID=A0A162K8D9_9BACL|nr:hypothetical protein [Paenibacillus glacialis]OAB44506.1 hypothetical protein PGLA_07575 [Paenibacillus glacialis]
MVTTLFGLTNIYLLLSKNIGLSRRTRTPPTSGSILDQSNLQNREQERTARAWAYEKLVPLTSILQTHKDAIRNRHGLVDYLNATEEFLDSAIQYFIEKYGLLIKVEDFHICFEPLGVLEWPV